MKLFLVWILFSLMLLLASAAFAQSQPPGITLAPNGLSKIFPPFDTDSWQLTRGSGDVTHGGDDYFAQDWARDCHSEGQRVYAGISGSLQMNPANDGHADYYGNTVVIVDYQAGFAQRFAHLSRFAPNLQNGDLILAGQLIGFVGATGNVSASSWCASQGGLGAHAHIVLYKNLPNLSGRPLDSVTTSGGPTSFAARFTYIGSEVLVKSNSNPTVYVLQNNLRIPVSAQAFASQGWNFDSHRIMFDPLAGNSLPQSAIDGLAQSPWFWPLRNGSLIKAPDDSTVFLVVDGQRRGLTGNVFACRNYSFADVITLPGTEIQNHQPLGSVPVASGCSDETRQALFDFAHVSVWDKRLGAAQLGTYQYSSTWDPDWDLRYMNFSFEGGLVSLVYHATLRVDSSVRYIMYYDPNINRWAGWFGMY